MAELCDLGLADAAQAVARGAISARELVGSVLARAERTEPVVHAYAYLDEASVRVQADAADDAVRRGERLGPLHGIPIGVKDVFDVQGWPTTAGSRALGTSPATGDAGAVAALRSAGAIVMGKTVAHELGFSANVPSTRNAWDPSRAPGGSSAGSAVAVAVGSAFGALGTDTGGSVRVPAAINGVVGFKPSFGAIDASGTARMSADLDTVGILARTADDVRRMFATFAGQDKISIRRAGPPDEFRIGYLEPDATGSIGSQIAHVVRTAVDTLARHGGCVEGVALPHPGLAASVGMVMVLADTSVEHGDLVRARWSDLESGTLATLLAGGALPDDTRDLARRLRAVVVD